MALHAIKSVDLLINCEPRVTSQAGTLSNFVNTHGQNKFQSDTSLTKIIPVVQTRKMNCN